MLSILVKVVSFKSVDPFDGVCISLETLNGLAFLSVPLLFLITPRWTCEPRVPAFVFASKDSL